MLKSFIVVLVWGFISTASGRDFGYLSWDRISSNLVLEATTVKKTARFKVGDEIVISALVRNVGKDVITLPTSCQSLDYKISVRGPGGGAPSLTSRGKQLTTPMLMVCPRRSRKLAGGESFE